MKCRIFGAVLLAALAVAPVAAQPPDGTDINKAIPIYYGQIIDDILDGATAARQVYKVSFARGQRVSISMTTADRKRISVCLLAGTVPTVQNARCIVSAGSDGFASTTAATLSYDVATAGTYYIQAYSFDPTTRFQLQVKAEGTPIAVPNPTSAGCLRGRVDSITYSLQLIAAGLPDEVVIGGTRACAACPVKAPLYPEIVNRIENAMRSRLNVEACHDAAGSIFQIKLVQP